MKVTKTANGHIQLVLEAETEIERVFLREMGIRAAKGQAVTLTADEGGAVTVGVEQ